MSTLQDTKHVYLQDILDLSALGGMIAKKRIKMTAHPTLPLAIYNYTDLATYAGEWTQAERVCRGLIVERGTGKIIARGPSKFFNYGEPSAKTYDLDTLVRVTKKEDGSLGIGWYYEDEHEEDEDLDVYAYGYATRGSFTSEQAVHATELVKNNCRHEQKYELTYDSLIQYYDGSNGCGKPITDLVEIVYPENRIVLDYGGRDELIGLGAVDNATGLICWRPSNGDCEPHVPTAPMMTLAEAIALPIPDDEEGYVLDILDADGNTIDHLKLKGARYKELHAAIFGLTERKVWEQVIEVREDEYIKALPDEVQPWALGVADRLYAEYMGYTGEIGEAMQTLVKLPNRKTQAMTIMRSHQHLSGALFAALDKDEDRVRTWIYNQIKPSHVPFTTTKETS